MNLKIAKSASRDFFLSVLALVIYNGVLQIIVYPYLNDKMGADLFGTALYMISVVSVMGMTFGSGASYGRMVARSKRTQTNGDYNIFLLTVALISVAVSFVTLVVSKDLSLGLFIELLVLMVITVLRYYSDVQYRMTIQFGKYFIFYASIAVGNLIGIALYPVSKSWVLTILLGELLAVFFTFCSGSIFRKPFLTRSESFAQNTKAVWLLSISNLVSALILNSDRILLKIIVGGAAVTVFYTATLIGKIVAMLTTPLNGIIISYLTNYKVKITKKIFSVICAIMLVVALTGTFVCCIVSDVFVKIMYPNVYAEASQYFLLANAGQIFFFISGSLMVVVLNFTREKLQLYINIIYMIVFAVVVIPATFMYGISGICVGLVITHVFRFILVAVFGFISLFK